MRTRTSSLLVAAAIVFSLTVVDLQAGDRFVDTHNPTGLPDITQSQVQERHRGQGRHMCCGDGGKFHVGFK